MEEENRGYRIGELGEEEVETEEEGEEDNWWLSDVLHRIGKQVMKITRTQFSHLCLFFYHSFRLFL